MIKCRVSVLSVITLLAIVLVTPCQPSYAKSPKQLTTAQRVSTWGTLGPLAIGGAAILARPNGVTVFGGIALGGIGLLWGPSSGHAYAGNTSRFFTGSSLRILAAGGVLGGLAMVGYGTLEEKYKHLTAPGIAVGVISFSAFVYIIVRDFTDLENSVSDYNNKNGFTSLDLRPEYFPSQEALGLTLNFRF